MNFTGGSTTLQCQNRFTSVSLLCTNNLELGSVLHRLKTILVLAGARKGIRKAPKSGIHPITTSQIGFYNSKIFVFVRTCSIVSTQVAANYLHLLRSDSLEDMADPYDYEALVKQ